MQKIVSIFCTFSFLCLTILAQEQRTLVGDMLLIKTEQNTTYLAPLQFQQPKQLNGLASKVVARQCESLGLFQNLLLIVKGTGRLEIQCLSKNIHKPKTTIIKSEITKYVWMRKNVYFKGVQGHVNVVWAKLDKVDGLFKNDQIFQKYKTLQLEPSVVLSTFLKNTVANSFKAVFQITEFSELNSLFYNWNKQIEFFQKIGVQITLILHVDCQPDILREIGEKIKVKQWREFQGQLKQINVDFEIDKIVRKGVYNVVIAA